MPPGKVTVLHIITRLTLGGSAENTIQSVLMGSRAGYRSILVSGPGEEDEVTIVDDARRRGVEVIVIPTLRRAVRPWRDLRALWAMIGLIRRERATIVHTHTSKAGLLGRIAAWLCRAPIVIHTPHGHIFYGYYGRLATAIFTMLERWMARVTDRIVTLTPRGIPEHLERGIGTATQYVAIPSGVNLDAVVRAALPLDEARKALEAPPHLKLLASVGRLVPIKGYSVLLAGLPKILVAVPEAHLMIAGDGELRETLDREADTLGVRHALTLLGARSDVPIVLSAADLVVLPSLNEGMGRVLVEAMALGKAVVATSVGGVPHVVVDGETGLLVPPSDPDALAKAIIALLTNPERCRAMGEAGRRRALAEFSLTVMEGRILGLYRDCLTEKGLASGAGGRGPGAEVRGSGFGVGGPGLG
ncbi:MAG TPA: glycosyltransferase family 4 protein [Methylomirabilota bacterium]|nr:glycosyltransferase family 4 protein [Methylomirabilota bacterium]